MIKKTLLVSLLCTISTYVAAEDFSKTDGHKLIPIAQSGNVDAQFNLGWDYDKGLNGMPKNEQKSFEWYQKAAYQGHAKAQSNLGWMYQRGLGVPVDLKKAATLYSLAAQQGNKIAQKNLKEVRQLIRMESNCNQHATTKIFGQKLECALRTKFRQAIKQGGAYPTQEDDGYKNDDYNSEDVMRGSDLLRVFYLDNGQFARAFYEFPSNMDTMQVRKIKNKVAAKYGRPNQVSGNINLGPVSYTWYLKDGIKLIVDRGWPNTTTYINYFYPTNWRKYNAEVRAYQKEKTKQQALKESNAF